MDTTRRNFIAAAAATAAVATVAGTALADDEAQAPEGGLDVLYDRTTLHMGYDPDKPLTDEQIDLILQAAFSAPTGGGQRALDFFAVTDREILDKLGEAHKNYGGPRTAPFAVVIAGAPYRYRFPELAQLDAGIAAEAMVVQATALGLSTLCMSIVPQADRMFNVMQALNIPYTTLNEPMYDPLIMVTFGYPAADAVTGASVLNYKETEVHFNGFTPEKAETVEAAKAETDMEKRTVTGDFRDYAIETIDAAIAE